jgi:hypothetical protein
MALISVIHRHGHYGLVANGTFARGALVCHVNGARTTQPSRWTLQVGARVHIEADPLATVDEQMARFPWRFLNHSCEPNTRIVRQNVVALRAIQPGEEFTFDYNTTEATMTWPFACHCGSANCHGTIRGFMHLPRHEQERLRPSLSAHLRNKLSGVKRPGLKTRPSMARPQQAQPLTCRSSES